MIYFRYFDGADEKIGVYNDDLTYSHTLTCPDPDAAWEAGSYYGYWFTLWADENYIYLLYYQIHYPKHDNFIHIRKFSLDLGTVYWTKTLDVNQETIPYLRYFPFNSGGMDQDDTYIYLTKETWDGIEDNYVKYIARVRKSDGELGADIPFPVEYGYPGSWVMLQDTVWVYTYYEAQVYDGLRKHRMDTSETNPALYNFNPFALYKCHLYSLSVATPGAVYKHNKVDFSWIEAYPHGIPSTATFSHTTAPDADGNLYMIWKVRVGSAYDITLFKINLLTGYTTSVVLQEGVGGGQVLKLAHTYIIGDLDPPEYLCPGEPSPGLSTCSDVPTSISTGSAAAARTAGWVPFHLMELYLDSGTVYLTNSDRPITWGGNLYTKFPFSMSAIKRSAGTFEESGSVTASNINRDISALLLGEIVEGRRITVRKCYWDQDFTNTAPYIVFDGQVDSARVEDGIGSSSVAFELKNEFWNWKHEIPSNSFSINCNHIFKSNTPGCQYAGTATECDKSLARCNALANTDRFRGFHHMKVLEDKEVWWGRIKGSS